MNGNSGSSRDFHLKLEKIVTLFSIFFSHAKISPQNCLLNDPHKPRNLSCLPGYSTSLLLF